MTVRTRFAPSPTGFLHIGGARTALFCWLEARQRGGEFILRIEDTDRERSTREAVQAILDGMSWLGLEHDEGPFYQTLRLDRYRQVAEDLLKAGKAYYAYESKEEIEAMRAEAMANKQKPRYNGYYRDRNEPYRDDPNRVIRFRNPESGSVVFDDKVKGRIEWDNEELDDLVLFRSDGFPTYNFAVVVDDIDMRITDVVRGDDHVNNTPRQINIYHALGAQVPTFAHLPMILGADGQKLSKRHGAVSVMQYDEEGYLPEAVINYLARLGWSHGDDEVFSREQFVEWFDLDHITPSAAQFNTEKLNWLNAQYIKKADDAFLAAEVASRLARREVNPETGPSLEAVVALYKDRVASLNELADAAELFVADVHPAPEVVGQHLTDVAKAALASLRGRLAAAEWNKAALSQAIKDTMAEHGLKMPQVAIPLRVAVLGVPQTPAIDAVLEVLGRGRVLERLDRRL